jgi:transposase
MSGRYNEMRAELASGKSTTEVAEMFNVTHRTVYRAKMAVK